MSVNQQSEIGRFSALSAELDAWYAGGLTCKFWVRDDDAVSDTPQLRRLFDVVRDLRGRVAIAVIPKHADHSLARILPEDGCCIWQHGWAHDFHSSGEFGEDRSLPTMIEDARLGAHAMDDLFGARGWQKVFVPPNHMLALPFKAVIHELGYLGISAGDPPTSELPGILEVNAQIDVMDWYGGKVLSEARLCQILLDQLQSRRVDGTSRKVPMGILTHHLAFDEDGWQSLRNLLYVIRGHAAAEFVHADELFAAGIETP